MEPRYECSFEHLEGGNERDSRRRASRIPSTSSKLNQWCYVGRELVPKCLRILPQNHDLQGISPNVKELPFTFDLYKELTKNDDDDNDNDNDNENEDIELQELLLCK